jgi:hypothetical protein
MAYKLISAGLSGSGGGTSELITNIKHIQNTDFTALNYNIDSTDFDGLTLIEVNLTGETLDHTITLPPLLDLNGRKIGIYYKEGDVNLTVLYNDGITEVETFYHSSDTITILADEIDNEWYVFQSTIQRTGNVDIDAGNQGVTLMSTLQDYMNFTWSATKLNGDGLITYNPGGTIDITSAEFLLRDTNSSTANLKPYKITSVTGLAIPEDKSYIIADKAIETYKRTIDITLANGNTEVPNNILFRQGDDLFDLEYGKIGTNFPVRYAIREGIINRLARGSGLIISTPGLLNVDLSAGSVFSGVIQTNTDAKQSSIDGIWQV